MPEGKVLPGDREWPVNDRHSADVEQAFMVGAVACENCRQVHIDFVDAAGNIFASGSLDYDRFIQLAVGVADDIYRITGAH